MLGENAVLTVKGARRWLRGPVRSGPTIPLLSVPIAIDWESPKPAAGEWQPAQALSRCSPMMLSKKMVRPSFTSFGSSRRPRRGSRLSCTRPVKPPP